MLTNDTAQAPRTPDLFFEVAPTPPTIYAPPDTSGRTWSSSERGVCIGGATLFAASFGIAGLLTKDRTLTVISGFFWAIGIYNTAKCIRDCWNGVYK